MKSSRLLAWLLAGAALMFSRLAAQDAIVTDPAWLDPQRVSSLPNPVFKKKPTVQFPGAQWDFEYPGYAIVVAHFGEGGEWLKGSLAGTNPFIFPNFTGSLPALRHDGKRIKPVVWYGIIYNPKTATETGLDATPRLLGVAPVFVQHEPPGGTTLPLIIWATLMIDEKGRLKEFNFDHPDSELYRGAVTASLPQWRFAPARKAGQPVAAMLRLPLVLSAPFDSGMEGSALKLVHRVNPRVPVGTDAGLPTTVVVEFDVLPSGNVRNPKIISATGQDHWTWAALEAVGQWKFARRNDKNANSVRMQQEFVFPKEGDAYINFVTADGVYKELMAQSSEPAESSIDVPAKLTRQPRIIYPYEMVVQRTKGSATAVVQVEASGKVSNVSISQATHPEFGLALAAALDTADYLPARRGAISKPGALTIQRNFAPDLAETLVKAEELELLNMERSGSEEIVAPSKLTSPLKLVSRREAVFPTALRGNIAKGEALIEVLISEEGRVCLPRVVKATDPAFGYAAMQAAIHCVFEPPMVGDKNVAVRAKIPFVFKLETLKLTPETLVPKA